MATVRHLGLFPRPNSTDQFPCLETIPTIEEDSDRAKKWHIVTLEQAMKMYWRVKRWQATIDAEYSVPQFETLPPTDEFPLGEEVFTGYETTTITEIQQFDPIDPPLLDNEKDLVCTQRSTPYWFTGIADEVGLFVQFSSVSGFGIDGPVQIRKDPDSDNLYVGFNAQIGFEEFAYLDDIEISEDLIMAVSWDRTRNPEDEYPEHYSGTVEVKPLEYWPYDPGDGLGPIYDSETGEQLRPFPE
jgi:hypothetical protein